MQEGSQFVETMVVKTAEGAVEVFAVGAKLGLMSSFLGDILDLTRDEITDNTKPSSEARGPRRALGMMS